MTNNNDPSAEFLVELVDTLVAMEGVDVELASILKIHLLKSAPAKDGVMLAKEKILQLADERAAIPQKGVA